jgi:crotonobetainyl-CoA:carnitine CoA-transferase CaiB-like acyl-CoA transferase
VSDGSAPPLAGVRVLDFTRFLAGPFCTMQLADLGADVIKVERPDRPREFSTGPGRDSYFFLSANRGKRSLALDYTSPEGRELILRLLPQIDVLIENFRPAVMGDLGLGPGPLCERFERLVYVSISGFGATGPYRDRPGFDQIAQGMSGLMSITGTPESGPLRHGLAIGDLVAGLTGAQGALGALFARAQTGRGQHVETSLVESLMGLLSWSGGMYFDSGQSPGPAGHHHPLSSPYGRFRGADGYINIAAGSEAMWQRLAKAMEREQWLTDERFTGPVERLRNRAALTAEIESALQAASVAEWVERLNEAGVPTGPVYSLDQVFTDPHILARDMLVELPHPALGTFKTTGLPLKWSRTPTRIERRPPLLAEHTHEVLEELGVSPAEIARLESQGVVRRMAPELA